MADFKIAYEKTLLSEGGYAILVNDKGGETWAGIARKQHPQWQGWEIVDDLKRQAGFPAILKNNSQLAQQVLFFYKVEFWDKISLDFVRNQEIAGKIYDIGVNCGLGFAAKALQRTLNVQTKMVNFIRILMLMETLALKQ